MDAAEIECTEPNTRRTYRLNPVMGFAEAKGLHDDLKAALGDAEVAVDASEVERMSTPCVQVLLAAALAADASGKPFIISDASGSFRSALADFGLQSKFSKWVA